MNALGQISLMQLYGDVLSLSAIIVTSDAVDDERNLRSGYLRRRRLR